MLYECWETKYPSSWPMSMIRLIPSLKETPTSSSISSSTPRQLSSLATYLTIVPFSFSNLSGVSRASFSKLSLNRSVNFYCQKTSIHTHFFDACDIPIDKRSCTLFLFEFFALFFLQVFSRGWRFWTEFLLEDERCIYRHKILWERREDNISRNSFSCIYNLRMLSYIFKNK